MSAPLFSPLAPTLTALPTTLEPAPTTPVPNGHQPPDDARAEVVEAFEDLARTLLQRLPANPYRYQVLLLLEQAGALARASFYFEEANVAPHAQPAVTK